MSAGEQYSLKVISLISLIVAQPFSKPITKIKKINRTLKK
ncbi:hypothetical protein SPBRAN_1477 [uncultured Candidatus Thioglobus sp.]|nr:hypothetical protein SPBRAN_1477 [uncultured Candidatus Thioglobus sp.]